MKEAMKIANARERGNRLLAIAECVERHDRASAIATRPPERGPSFAIAGGSTWTMIGYRSGTATVPAATSVGAFVALEAAWRIHRRVSLGAFLGYAPFRDASYVLDGFITYDVGHDRMDFGATARVHLDRASLAIAIGAVIDRAAPLHAEPEGIIPGDVAGYTMPFALAGVELGYELLRRDRFAIDLRARGTYEHPLGRFDGDLVVDGDAFSARVALALRIGSR
jgi:hypothetical protein